MIEEIVAATGLSDPEFGILTRIDEHGGVLRQNALAELMGWHRSRLSHQLSRTKDRGLLHRRPVEGGVEVVNSRSGRELAERARPIHAAAVRRHFSEQLTAPERNHLRTALRRLTPDDAGTHSDAGDLR